MATNNRTAEQRPEQLGFIFEWTSAGLEVIQAPDKMDFYPITLHLQRSLIRTPPGPISEGAPSATSQTIPFGVIANLLYRSRWCNLSLNFEPGPDRLLRTYFSIDDPRPPRQTEAIRVAVSSGNRRVDRNVFTRGTYQSPALSPGTYLFRVTQADAILTEIRLDLSGNP